MIQADVAITEDLFMIKMQQCQWEDARELGGGFLQMVEQSVASETLRDPKSGRIIAIVGLVLPKAHCGSVWSLICDDIGKRGLSLTKKTLALIDAAAKRFELRRMDMMVREDEIRHVRWAEVLKFEREGVIKHFGPQGENYILFARYWV